MSLRTALSRVGALFDMVDAAISVAASLRAHRSPSRRDLSRLGINADAATIAAMAKY